MLDSESQENNADLALSDTNKRKSAESTIEKWYNLQKTIKETITLEDIISKQQKVDSEKLKNYFKEYYKKKLEIRRTSEEITRIENNNENISKKINMEKEIEHMFLDISEPIKNLLFLFRTNYDYIITLISLITEDDDEEKISSLVELFCNQFYENILIRNNGTDELIILIYKLFEKEISSMNFASIDEFLNNDTFIGKFISSYLKRYELKNFLSSIINPFILNIEYYKLDDYCGMSIIKINECFKEKTNIGSQKKDKLNHEFNIEKALFSEITKSSIKIKNEDDDTNEDDFDDEDELEQKIFESWNKKMTDEPDNKNINDDYKIMFDLDYLENKISNEKNLDLKNFYSYELEKITYDPDIFSNKSFIDLLKEKEYNDNLKNIVKIYKDNFKFLKNTIDYFIQLLIDQIELFPYQLRCLCKIISILLKQKFPLLIKYVRNGFIGKFIFDKFIFPMFFQENKNFLESRFLSKNTKKCLIDIISILNHANKCLLYNSNIDCEKTIFNHYLIEIIPMLNKFYEKLIDVDIPPILYKLIENFKESEEKNKPDNSYNIRKEGIKNDNNNIKRSSTEEFKPLYDYFNENKEEILNIQCICFSLDDILFILTLIGRNIKAFKHLPDYIFFERTYEFIQPSDYKLDQENTKNPDTRNFFIIFKEEQNSFFKNYKKEKKNQNIISFSQEEADSSSVSKRFKFCIKKVLKGLNFLNRKDYAYLNMAINSKNFFTAIKNILEDHGEFSLIKSRIPLKWYAEYIYNNQDNLDDKYKFDDYKEIYNEIFIEESNNLEKLSSILSLINIKDQMYISCAENILSKTKNELTHIEEMMENVQIEKFINEEDIEVCIQTSELKNGKADKRKSIINQKNNESKQFPIPLLITDNLNCLHNFNKSNEVHENNNSETKIPYHAYNINEFISKFSDTPWKEETIKYDKPKTLVFNEIANGSNNYQIYKSLNMYMEIVKKHLIQPKNGQQIFKDYENLNNILGKIKEYIIRQIYKFVFPSRKLSEDSKFINKVKSLQWVTPEHLNIKSINISHLNNEISWIKRFEFYKSIKDKMNCIYKIYIDINNEFRLANGFCDESNREEIKLIFFYIIIKSQPERMLSNINYIKCFTDCINLNEIYPYLLVLLESSKEFVLNISDQYLNITKEEYDKNMTNSTK